MVLNQFSDGLVRAIYIYDKYDTPIVVNGNWNANRMSLHEVNEQGDTTAILLFDNLSASTEKLSGAWRSGDRNLPIELNKTLEFDYYDASGFESIEFPQAQSTETHYFRIVVSKIPDDATRVNGVRIYEKGTDRLIQSLELEADFIGLDNVTVGDFNFDGHQDFAVFEASYAGPNTSSIYFLKEPGKDTYFRSSFTGTSLEFDEVEKLVQESDVCCAGRYIRTAKYKVVNNELVLLAEECLEYDEAKEDYVVVNCE